MTRVICSARNGVCVGGVNFPPGTTYYKDGELSQEQLVEMKRDRALHIQKIVPLNTTMEPDSSTASKEIATKKKPRDREVRKDD